MWVRNIKVSNGGWHFSNIKTAKEIEEAVFGEKCGTRYKSDAAFNDTSGDYEGGTVDVPPAQVEQGLSPLGGNCTGTIVFEGTTMTWSKVTKDTNDADGDGDTTELIDNPYVELIIDGPDGGTTSAACLFSSSDALLSLIA